ncbi:hypothetical protein P7M41_25930, partial [Vibrio parahaemolyticus]|nr:hypothetical protein [Vibrio parahaemolyticus]
FGAKCCAWGSSRINDTRYLERLEKDICFFPVPKLGLNFDFIFENRSFGAQIDFKSKPLTINNLQITYFVS